MLYQFVRAAITTYSRLGDLTEMCFLTVVHVQEEGVGGSVSLRFVLGCRQRLSPSPHVAFLCRTVLAHRVS